MHNSFLKYITTFAALTDLESYSDYNLQTDTLTPQEVQQQVEWSESIRQELDMQVSY